ncbi:MAG TPA: hypothetical protein VM367_02475 [Pseudonocardia sp.]|nr:hypothetical protein [Pseudonocardia sp.]
MAASSACHNSPPTRLATSRWTAAVMCSYRAAIALFVDHEATRPASVR